MFSQQELPNGTIDYENVRAEQECSMTFRGINLGFQGS